MKILLNKTHTFIEVVNGSIGRHLTVPHKAGIQTVPDWVRESDGFKMGVKDGSVTETSIQPAAALPTAPPTVDEVMTARNCSKGDAEAIVTLETDKFNAGQYPYPAKTPIAPVQGAPTVESLMVLGLSREQAQRALTEPAAPAPADSAKTNGRGKKNPPAPAAADSASDASTGSEGTEAADTTKA